MSAGASDEEFLRARMRLQLHGLEIGQKYHSREFVKLTEHLGASLIRMLDAADFHEVPARARAAVPFLDSF